MKVQAKNNWGLKYALLFSLVVSAISMLGADGAKVYMSMEYTHFVHQQKVIKVSVRERIDKKFFPISQLQIPIFIETVQGDSLIAEIMSNKEGIAYFIIDEKVQLYTNDNGVSVITANFKGNEGYNKAKKVVKVKELYLKADIKDREIQINGMEVLSNKDTLPADQLNVSVYAERMFTDIKIGEVTLVEGAAAFKYADNLPGDNEGNIKLKLVIDDKNYQLVVYEMHVPWGQTTVKQNSEEISSAMSYIIFLLGSVVIVVLLGIFVQKKIISVK